ncbi:DNA alkylation repair protein [Mucilaginibacter sp. AW1-7]|uniref:DNA alkylation repair protein n=1 Tax=Mucilaginibacter sp. AW1-7 TaxID=3349874 RepID=UPI003F73A7E7
MQVDEILGLLKQQANPTYLTGMQRFGIDSSRALGVKLPAVRKLAKGLKKDHVLAQQLWDTGVHEARIMASLVDDPAWVTEQQIDSWTKDFYSWDLCDQVCGNLFDRTSFVVAKAIEFSAREEEFVKRAGFVLMAEYAVHNKKAPDDIFIPFFAIMEREAWDSRNFVKKAINWALRQIGKRNSTLKAVAIAAANRIANQNCKSARWIGSNALAELIIDKNFLKKYKPS